MVGERRTTSGRFSGIAEDIRGVAADHGTDVAGSERGRPVRRVAPVLVVLRVDGS
jgi:hypothetical protein